MSNRCRAAVPNVRVRSRLFGGGRWIRTIGPPSAVGGQHFSRPPFGRSGLALPRGRRSVPPKRRGRSAVDEVGLIDIFKHQSYARCR